MDPTSWRQARLDEIPSRHDDAFWAQWAEDPAFGRGWHSIRDHFDLTSFGINAHEAEAGGQLVVAHDERDDDDQDELYYVVRGRARFTLNGENVEVAGGEMLCVGAHVMREAWALEEPTLLLMLGATPGGPYRVPEWDGG